MIAPIGPPSTSPVPVLILFSGFLVAFIAGVVAYSVSGPYGERDRADPRVRRFTDPATGQLRLLVFDASGDGRFDTWSYMDGDRVVRQESDEDDDGLIDRWEYYRPDHTVEKIGVSTAHDGRPDTWQYLSPSGAQRTEQPDRR